MSLVFLLLSDNIVKHFGRIFKHLEIDLEQICQPVQILGTDLLKHGLESSLRHLILGLEGEVKVLKAKDLLDQLKVILKMVISLQDVGRNQI